MTDLSEKKGLVDPNRVLVTVAAVAKEARPHVDAYVALDSSLERDLGLDSLARVELVLRLERELGISLPEQALASSETPRDLLRYLLASAGQAPHAADRSVASLVQSEGVRPPAQAQTSRPIPNRASVRGFKSECQRTCLAKPRYGPYAAWRGDA